MSKKRKSISKSIRFEVFKRDSFTCQYCGASAPQVLLQVDHIQPVSKGGNNDLLNLITSCAECNGGKSNRVLRDDSVLKKQKQQLDDLQSRREQLELMLEWRNGLREMEERWIDIVADDWSSRTGTILTATGRASVKKMLNAFGLERLLEAAERSEQYFRYDNEGGITLDSVTHAFDKLGGICRMLDKPEWIRELYYIRGILRKRLRYCNDTHAIRYLTDAYNAGISLTDLRAFATEVDTWTAFRNEMESIVCEGNNNG